MNLQAWLDLLEKRHPQTIDLGLERCGRVYQSLGSPRPAKKVFTVAGTNGKGSTVAYLSMMSGSLGQRFGSYTSPHVFRFNERISVMGEPVSDECLVQAFERVEAVRNGISLTYFEFTTLAALLILHNADLDCAVLEVGLGGRLDTVNLVDTDCAIITPIGLDHQEYLGSDLASIAKEKAGIIRSGTVVVCSQARPPRPILQLAESLNARIYRRDVDFDLTSQSGVNGDSEMMQFSMADQIVQVAKPPMSGRHQIDNLATALAALVLLNPGCANKAIKISAAIRNCRLPGRLQSVHFSPEIILDVGHNQLAADTVANFLKQSRRTNTTCVLAMLADKSAEAIALALNQVCKRWLCADSNGARGQTGKQLARRIKTVLPAARINVFGPLADAMSKAVSSAGDDETILVFGSFTTVTKAADWLHDSLQRETHDAARITTQQTASHRRDHRHG